MGLKNDDDIGFSQSINESEDSGPTLLASVSKRDQKGSGQDNDGSYIKRRVNEAKEAFYSGMDEDDRSGSCENSLGQGVEAVDSKTKPRSPGLGHDVEDRQLETRKHGKSSPSSKGHGHKEKATRSNQVMESNEKGEPSLQVSTGDDDETDVEEEDVKVCDICGDAGREDLLAVCSRCSDGAEHTYCMREMLDKVPEDNWLCEECKYNEALEARRQEHLKWLGCSERSKCLGKTNSSNSDVSSTLDNKDSFSERSNPKSVSLSKQLSSSKRSGDSIEAGLAAKKQIVESITGSPTALSPSRVPVLSKESSFKNLDKTKGKPTSQLSTGTESAGDSSENTRSPTRNPKGNLAKSNSFSSSSLKTNVKVSEEVIQKQKQAVDTKDGLGKLSGKSMSFKGLGRSSVSEPKVKMLSPKCAPVQESKGQKPIRDRSSFERKNSMKLDNSFPIQTTATSTKRLSRVDSISSLSVSNSREFKNAQSDGKLNSLSKQACHLAHKSSDASSSLGEVKRLSSTNIRGSGTSSSAEAKSSHASFKDGLNSSRAADGSLVGANGTKADVHDNQSEKVVENNFGRTRQGVNGALGSGSRRGLSSDTILRAKDGVHEENKLKAAIEAAMQKKQDIFKKNKIPDKLNELSTSNTQGINVGDAVSNQPLDSIPEEVVHTRDTRLFNNTSNSLKHLSTGSAKKSKIYPADFVSSCEEDSAPSVSAIPEQEAVWQGGFEIHRNGKHPDVCGGFQAHLSIFASDKVLEVVRKLPQKIVFNEVSRSCAWPFQFKDSGAREDNIALYFFAKDLESYMRSYKILLDYMMKHDLALKGNINGVELLILPSNLLAHRSQRWNTLFFMWGVFRGRRTRFPDDICATLEKRENAISVSNTVPRFKDASSTACVSEIARLQRPAIEDLPVSGSDTVVSRCEAPAVDELSLEKSDCLANGDCSDEGCNEGRTSSSSPTNLANFERRPEKYSSRSESGTSVLEDDGQLDPNIVSPHRLSLQEVDSGINLHKSKKPLSSLMLDKQIISSHSSKVHMVDAKEGGSVFTSEEKQVLYTVSENGDEKPEISVKQEDRSVDNVQKIGGQVKVENNVDQEDGDKHSSLKSNEVMLKGDQSLKREGCVDINVSADCGMEDLHGLQCSPKRHLEEEDSTKLTSEAVVVLSCQKRPWIDGKDVSEGNDQECIRKKIKETDNLYGCSISSLPSSFSNKFDTQMHDVSTSSRIEDTSNEAVDEKSTSVNPGSAERCFFVVDSHAQIVPSEDHSSSWKGSLLGNEDRLPGGSPNLELALGVEKNQSRKGVLPFFTGIVDRKGSDRPPDIASPKDEYEDVSASLSLSLAFPFSDKDGPVRTTVEQTLPTRREANTSLLFFRGSSGK